jgi:hypothetical protein
MVFIDSPTGKNQVRTTSRRVAVAPDDDDADADAVV